VRKSIATPLLVAGTVALLGGSAAGTYQQICKLSWGQSYLNAGPSYCHNAAVVFYHTLENCPCRAKGSVSATGPFACTFHSYIAWGGPFGGGSSTQDAPTAMVTTYDIPLDCGEAYKVDLACACEGRPKASYFIDNGACLGECEDPPVTEE